MIPNVKRVTNASFLVAGTCVGGGMLALPVATCITGFYPSILTMGLCWLAMTASGLLLVEVSLALGGNVHIITMNRKLLGPVAKAISWLLYLFISYASLIAYTAGAGAMTESVALNQFDVVLGKSVACTIFGTFFGLIVLLGNRYVGRVNTMLFLGAVAAYVGLVGSSVMSVDTTRLQSSDISSAYLAIPLLLTAFSFQTMVPSLGPYLNGHGPSLRLCVCLGSTIAFVIYLLWQLLVLGVVPLEGTHGLYEAMRSGVPATEPLAHHVGNAWIGRLADAFAFFALVTSFLGIALGLYDFLEDGLRVKNRVLLGLLVIAPTIFFAITYERVFLIALDTSGGFGDSILNGIFPVLMIGVLCRKQQLEGLWASWTGKILLALIFVFYVGALLLELAMQTGFLSPIYDLDRSLDF